MKKNLAHLLAILALFATASTLVSAPKRRAKKEIVKTELKINSEFSELLKSERSQALLKPLYEYFETPDNDPLQLSPFLAGFYLGSGDNDTVNHEDLIIAEMATVEYLSLIAQAVDEEILSKIFKRIQLCDGILEAYEYKSTCKKQPETSEDTDPETLSNDFKVGFTSTKTEDAQAITRAYDYSKIMELDAETGKVTYNPEAAIHLANLAYIRGHVTKKTIEKAKHSSVTERTNTLDAYRSIVLGEPEKPRLPTMAECEDQFDNAAAEKIALITETKLRQAAAEELLEEEALKAAEIKEAQRVAQEKKQAIKQAKIEKKATLRSLEASSQETLVVEKKIRERLLADEILAAEESMRKYQAEKLCEEARMQDERLRQSMERFGMYQEELHQWQLEKQLKEEQSAARAEDLAREEESRALDAQAEIMRLEELNTKESLAQAAEKKALEQERKIILKQIQLKGSVQNAEEDQHRKSEEVRLQTEIKVAEDGATQEAAALERLDVQLAAATDEARIHEEALDALRLKQASPGGEERKALCAEEGKEELHPAPAATDQTQKLWDMLQDQIRSRQVQATMNDLLSRIETDLARSTAEALLYQKYQEAQARAEILQRQKHIHAMHQEAYRRHQEALMNEWRQQQLLEAYQREQNLAREHSRAMMNHYFFPPTHTAHQLHLFPQACTGETRALPTPSPFEAGFTQGCTDLTNAYEVYLEKIKQDGHLSPAKDPSKNLETTIYDELRIKDASFSTFSPEEIEYTKGKLAGCIWLSQTRKKMLRLGEIHASKEDTRSNIDETTEAIRTAIIEYELLLTPKSVELLSNAFWIGLNMQRADIKFKTAAKLRG